MPKLSFVVQRQKTHRIKPVAMDIWFG